MRLRINKASNYVQIILLYRYNKFNNLALAVKILTNFDSSCHFLTYALKIIALLNIMRQLLKTRQKNIDYN